MNAVPIRNFDNIQQLNMAANLNMRNHFEPHRMAALGAGDRIAVSPYIVRQRFPDMVSFEEFTNMCIQENIQNEETHKILYLHFLAMKGYWDSMLDYSNQWLATYETNQEKMNFINTSFSWLYNGGNLLWSLILWNAPNEVLDNMVEHHFIDIDHADDNGYYIEEIVNTSFYTFQLGFIFQHRHPMYLEFINGIQDNNEMYYIRDEQNDFEVILRHYDVIRNRHMNDNQ